MDTPLLRPTGIHRGHPAFAEACGYNYAQGFVARLLATDIPQLMAWKNCQFYVFHNSDDELVGFGTLHKSDQWSSLVGGKEHYYIPLLAVRKEHEGKKYGKFILNHLIETAALHVFLGKEMSDRLILDVYTDGPVSMYEKAGFEHLIAQPQPDPEEGGRAYHIMGKRLSK